MIGRNFAREPGWELGFMTCFISSLSVKFEVAEPPPHPPHNVKFGEMSVGLVNIFDPGTPGPKSEFSSPPTPRWRPTYLLVLRRNMWKLHRKYEAIWRKYEEINMRWKNTSFSFFYSHARKYEEMCGKYERNMKKYVENMKRHMPRKYVENRWEWEFCAHPLYK